MMFTDCSTTSTRFDISKFVTFLLMSTAITMSAPFSRATEIGILSTRPPSTRSLSLVRQRMEDAGDGTARPHCFCHRAAVQHDTGAAVQVGGDRGKRQFQVLDVLDGHFLR